MFHFFYNDFVNLTGEKVRECRGLVFSYIIIDAYNPITQSHTIKKTVLYVLVHYFMFYFRWLLTTINQSMCYV